MRLHTLSVETVLLRKAGVNDVAATLTLCGDGKEFAMAERALDPLRQEQKRREAHDNGAHLGALFYRLAPEFTHPGTFISVMKCAGEKGSVLRDGSLLGPYQLIHFANVDRALEKAPSPLCQWVHGPGTFCAVFVFHNFKIPHALHWTASLCDFTTSYGIGALS